MLAKDTGEIMTTIKLKIQLALQVLLVSDNTYIKIIRYEMENHPT